MSFTLAGYPLMSGHVSMSLSGTWTGTFNIDSEDVLTGGAELILPGEILRCTVLPGDAGGGIVEGINHCRVVGGAGGLRKTVGGQHYYYSIGRDIARHTLGQVGEELSDLIDDDILFVSIEHWMRMAGTAGRAIDILANKLGLEWRVQPDGKVWLGETAWKEVIVPADFTRLSLQEGRIELAADDQTVMPGTTLRIQDTQSLTIEEGAWRVLSVDHYLSEGTTWRSVVHYEREPAL